MQAQIIKIMQGYSPGKKDYGVRSENKCKG